MIVRKSHLEQLQRLLKGYPVVALLGARQVGKTTLAKMIAAAWQGTTRHFDLEDPRDLAQLEDPTLALEPLRGLVVLDEVQRKADLFPLLRVLADRRPIRTRFLVLGSASPDFLRQSSESLAGRLALYTLPGLNLEEVSPKHLDTLWLRGGFPRSFTVKTHKESCEWRRNFVQLFVERDLRNLGINVPARTLDRFWAMLAHYHGQVLNVSELARAFGVSDHTVRHYLDLLTATFVVRQVRPWQENLSKRQVKMPKVYLSDSGLLHTLLDIETRRQLERHPKVGASWEGFILDTLTQHLKARPDQCYFWATHQGAELDLLITRGSERRGFEVKRTTTPKLTRSMHIALEDLRLNSLDVVHAGKDTFPLAPKVRAVAADRLLEDVPPL